MRFDYPFETIRIALRFVFQERRWQITGLLLFAMLLPVYLFTLPSSFTGAQIGWASLGYLTPRLVFFAFVFSLLLSLVFSLTLFLFREGMRAPRAGATGGLLASLVTPLLCCSPLLPAIMSGIAVVLPFLPRTAGLSVQKFIVVNEMWIYTLIVLLLVFAMFRNARAVLSCQRRAHPVPHESS